MKSFYDSKLSKTHLKCFLVRVATNILIENNEHKLLGWKNEIRGHKLYIYSGSIQSRKTPCRKVYNVVLIYVFPFP